jgi:holo-[acyl-carrier protein] synthase
VIGVGIDAVEVARFRTVLARTPAMSERLFTPDELAYATKAKDPTERLAARFAAKEAVLKAMGVGLGACGWHDIEVVRAESGAPSLVLTAAAAELAAERGVQRWHLSLTHTTILAEAIAICE